MKLQAWHYRETFGLNVELPLEWWQTGLQARAAGSADAPGAMQRIIPIVNFLVVYLTHSEGNRAVWFLPLPFQRAFVSLITPQQGNIVVLRSLVSKHVSH